MTAALCHSDLQIVTESLAIHSPTQYAVLGELRDFSALAAYAYTATAVADNAAAVMTRVRRL